MGLASKLAQAQAANSPYGAPPAAAPGVPPPAAHDPTKDVDAILRILGAGVVDQNLRHFYPAGSLPPLARRIAESGALSQIAAKLHLPIEIAMDMARLALYDTVLYLDDSGSMTLQDRIPQLQSLVSTITYAAGLFDADGIQVRWMNSKKEGNNFTKEEQVADLISKIKFNRGTPLGTSLKEKVLEPLITKPAKKNKLRKPVLVVCVTDGAPTFEPQDTIVKVIREAQHLLEKTPYTQDAFSLGLCQVGDDLEARAFLEYIDENKEIGNLVDTTSSFEHEQDNFAKAKNPIHLTRELWIAKLLLGPIHSGYDAADE